MKKKVLILNNHFQYSDGTVTALVGMVNNLDLEKFDITVMPLYRCDKNRKQELSEGIKLKKAFGFYFRGFSKLAKMIPISWLYRWLINGKYDIEIAYQCDLPTILVGNSKNEKAVHVAWMHTYDLWPECYAHCDKVVCVSKCNAVRTDKEMNGEVDVSYLYNLVDDAKIKAMGAEKLDLELPASPVIVSVGRLSPEKGYVRLVKILGELRDEGFDFYLILIGEGTERASVENEISKRNLGDRIILTGAQTNPHKYTAKADLFVCSSFSEGYSTACTEAAILGTPIITTDVAGGEEIINDCECGMLTGLDDESLKNALRKVLQNPDMLMQWKNTMKTTSAKFGLEERKKKLTAFFDELIDISDKKIRKENNK